MLQSGEAVTFHTPYILCNDYMMERLQLLCDQNHSVTVRMISCNQLTEPCFYPDGILTGLHP